MPCLNRRNRLTQSTVRTRLFARICVGTLAVLAVAGIARAQEPDDLRWWSARPRAAQQQNADSSAKVTVNGPPAAASSAESDPGNLLRWESKTSLDELKWWNAESRPVDSGWWSEGRSKHSVIAVQDEFAPRPAAPRQPKPATPEPLPEQGRTIGADGVEFDPFSVVPPLKPLSSISATLASDPSTDETEVEGEPPFVGTAEDYFAQYGSVHLATRVWPNRTPEAAAYKFYSRPLWYEDANLERCGYTCGCLQPVVSGTYFFANTALLPYRFAAEPQCEVVPQKDFCPPGCRYSHCDNYLPPWSAAGAVSQAAAVTGLVFLIP